MKACLVQKQPYRSALIGVVQQMQKSHKAILPHVSPLHKDAMPGVHVDRSKEHPLRIAARDSKGGLLPTE